MRRRRGSGKQEFHVSTSLWFSTKIRNLQETREICFFIIIVIAFINLFLKLSFRIYDHDEDGFIDKNELMSMLKAIMGDNLIFNLSEQHMQALVDSTFKEAGILL